MMPGRKGFMDNVEMVASIILLVGAGFFLGGIFYAVRSCLRTQEPKPEIEPITQPLVSVPVNVAERALSPFEIDAHCETALAPILPAEEAERARIPLPASSELEEFAAAMRIWSGLRYDREEDVLDMYKKLFNNAELTEPGRSAYR